MKTIKLELISQIFVLMLASLAAAQSVNSGITYHGRLMKPDGTPVDGSAVQFQIQIRTPGSENCLLYSEIQTKDLSQTQGVFSVTLNDGTGTRNDGHAWTMDQVFANQGSTSFNVGDCVTGNSKSWSATDGRKVVVYFNDASFAGWEGFPAEAINFVPMSIESQQVSGYRATNLLRADVGTTVPELTSGQVTELFNLLSGSSNQYVVRSTSAGVSFPSYAGTTPSSPSAGSVWYDSTSKQIKFYDGTASQTVGTSTVAASTSGTIGGTTAVNTSGNIQTTGSITTKSFFLYDHSGVGPGYIGMQAPTNVTSNYTMTWPATAGSAGQVLTTDGAGVLSWSTPSGGVASVSGTAPISSSGGATPTISISQSDTTTSGYLSSTDWNTFNNKLGTGTSFSGDVSGAYNSTSVDKIKGKTVSPAAYSAGQVLRYDGTNWVNAVLGFSDLGSKPTTLSGYGITDAQSTTLADGKILVGNSSNVATAVTMSGDATLSNAGALTLAKVPVSKGGTNVTSFSGNQIVGTNGTGNALTSFTCGVNQVIAFDASGYAVCSSVSTLSGSFVNGGNSFGAAATLGTNDNYSLGFKTNNTTQMTIDNTGNVGIGTTSPTDLLHLAKNNSSAGASGILLHNAVMNASWYPSHIYGRTTTGTITSPGSTLDGDLLLKIAGQGYASGSFSDAASIQFIAAGNHGFATYPGAITINTTPSGGSAAIERVRIDASGYVGIGTTSPGSKLDVKGTLRLSGSTSGYVGLAPAAAAGSTTYTLPSADGSSNQVLATNGSGELSWSSAPKIVNIVTNSNVTASQNNTLLASAPTGLYRVTSYVINSTIASSGSGCSGIMRYYYASGIGNFSVGSIGSGGASGTTGTAQQGTYTFYHADPSYEIRIDFQRTPGTCTGDTYTAHGILELIKAF